jgi:hypothetical protein
MTPQSATLVFGPAWYPALVAKWRHWRRRRVSLDCASQLLLPIRS